MGVLAACRLQSSCDEGLHVEPARLAGEVAEDVPIETDVEWLAVAAVSATEAKIGSMRVGELRRFKKFSPSTAANR
jgi:hypothetical protein